MNVPLAIEYIPRRMKELGHGNDYYINFRHLVVAMLDSIEIDAQNQLYILTESVHDVTISSDFGVYDLDKADTNEQMHEHQGYITITNNGKFPANLKFIQVIPKNKK